MEGAFSLKREKKEWHVEFRASAIESPSHFLIPFSIVSDDITEKDRQELLKIFDLIRSIV